MLPEIFVRHLSALEAGNPTLCGEVLVVVTALNFQGSRIVGSKDLCPSAQIAAKKHKKHDIRVRYIPQTAKRNMNTCARSATPIVQAVPL